MDYLETSKRSPKETLDSLAKQLDCDITDRKFYQWLDENDELAHFQKEFNIPKHFPSKNGNSSDHNDSMDCIHFCGNSLGIQPKKTAEFVEKVLHNWGDVGLSCHFKGYLPAATCEDFLCESMSKIVGANKDEVAVMNGLTVNLHLLLVSFYQPTESRHKILLESKAFPSDHYAVESQIRQRGFDPEKSMLLLKPREGEDTWRPEDILDLIEREGDSIAVVMLSGVHYYTGQLFDMESITKVAQRKGCWVGFDLAHAAGNVELHLHDWGVDFACWCTYKYLNSGPGAIACAFLHRKHENNNFNKFLGWWGHKMSTRFEMNNEMDLAPGIQGYKLSNQSPLLVACCRASLDLFDQATMTKLRGKSVVLTGYLEMLLKHYFSKDKDTSSVEIITPSDYRQRGCQLSLKFNCSLTKVHENLKKRGVACDLRSRVMRIAPTPLYNSFRDVYRFVEILTNSFE